MEERHNGRKKGSTGYRTQEQCFGGGEGESSGDRPQPDRKAVRQGRGNEARAGQHSERGGDLDRFIVARHRARNRRRAQRPHH